MEKLPNDSSLSLFLLNPQKKKKKIFKNIAYTL